MEVEEEKNIHYLHPDFEMENGNMEKKLSPLALLAQTCQSIGSGKDCKYTTSRDKSCSPISTATSTKRSIKRQNSDYLSNSSSSPSLDRVCTSPTKKTKTGEVDINSNSKIELNHADTSSDLGKEINQSLMNSFMNFLRNSNNSQQSYSDKVESLYFLSNRLKNQDTISNEVLNFNISNDYHLKSPTHEFLKSADDNLSVTNSQSISFEKLNSHIDLTQKSHSTIKYCMYCGKLIPVLPILLAHIKINHGTEQFSETRSTTFNTQAPTLCDFLTKINPFQLPSQIKSSQSSPVPSITNYINSWSSLLGCENFIF